MVTPSLTDQLRKMVAFDERDASETAMLVVREIEALCWADNWTVHKGIPRVTERLKYQHARLQPILTKLIAVVDACEMLETRYNYVDQNGTEREGCHLDDALQALREEVSRD